ncbi:cytochrome P450 [Ganoderma leucocontextum]|nr:cytochrome P450 [Ganoderma leucocontextum]
MASLGSIIAGAICLLVFPQLVSYYRSKRHGRPPPGPPGLPLVGNVRDIPAPHEYPWLKYHNWCCEYNSDIIRLNTLGSNIVVLDTLEAANELLDRRSAIYSGRAGFGWGFGSMDYGEDWRVCRKMTHHEFHATAFKKYRPILAQHAHEFVCQLTKESVARVPVHLKHMTGANIMEATYSIKVLPEDDPFIELTEAGQEAFSKCAIGFYLVEIFPLLRHVPAWFPGAGFKRQAAVWHEAATRQLHVPYADYQGREVRLGKADESMAKVLAEVYGTDESTVRCAKMATATMYMGPSTYSLVAAIIHSFFLTMVLYPDCHVVPVASVQLTVDSSCTSRGSEDCAGVPKTRKLSRADAELLRWQPIVRLVDDTYNGYYLEKDSLIIVNIWSILHDDKVFSDPHTFTLDRFLKNGILNPDILDPQEVAFGFRRRACPGRYMVYDTM